MDQLDVNRDKQKMNLPGMKPDHPMVKRQEPQTVKGSGISLPHDVRLEMAQNFLSFFKLNFRELLIFFGKFLSTGCITFLILVKFPYHNMDRVYAKIRRGDLGQGNRNRYYRGKKD